MKIKFVALFIAIFMAIPMMNVAAQPHQCGDMNGLSVVYPKVDNMGVLAQPMPGSEARFNCIAARDPDFASRRFQSSWEAANYWFILYSQELGVSLQPLPAPTG